MRNKRILVAALNWGLGHATRCIPLIKELKAQEYEPVIASDGPALELLKKEFPDSIFETLPSYNIAYTRKGSLLKWKLLLDSPRILRTIQAEKQLTSQLVTKHNLKGIISDNRWGVRSHLLDKNVFITHQLNVLSGSTTKISSQIQQYYLRKFDECWIPDNEGEPNLSGILGHPHKKPENIKYIGPLSRFDKKELPVIYDCMVLLSGPEPQRSILETILLKVLSKTAMKVLFIRGVIKGNAIRNTNDRVTIRNYLTASSLETAINSSRFIISRSGYTTLMDLSKLEKKAFFIPTPGQKEQEYLAKRMKKAGMAPFCEQGNFTLNQLKKIDNYSGLSNFGNDPSLRDCFAFFKSK